MNLYLTQNKR